VAVQFKQTHVEESSSSKRPSLAWA